MRSVSFPYTVHKGIALPYIPLTLKIGKIQRRFWAFVDSGATYSIFKAEEMENLCFDYRSGKCLHVQVGDGGFIPVYLHKIHMTLDTHTFSATIGISNKLGIEFNLLGRHDIFTRFDVTFSDKKGQISFSEN